MTVVSCVRPTWSSSRLLRDAVRPLKSNLTRSSIQFLVTVSAKRSRVGGLGAPSTRMAMPLLVIFVLVSRPFEITFGAQRSYGIEGHLASISDADPCLFGRLTHWTCGSRRVDLSGQARDVVPQLL